MTPQPLQDSRRRRGLHLARRPLPRAHRDRQPRRARRRARRRRRHDEPVDLRGGTRRRASGYDAQVRELAAERRRRRRDGLRADHHRRPRRLRRCCARLSTRTDGVDGRVSIEVDPRAGPRHRRRPSPRPRSCGRPSTSPTCSSRSRRPSRACRRSPQVLGRGHQRQRDADLRPRPLPRRDGGLPRRARAGPGRTATTSRRSTRSRPSSSPASTARSTSGSTPSAPTRPGPLKGKAGVANARLAYQAYEEVFSATALGLAGAGGRPPAAAAVGLHRASRTPTTPTRCTSPSSSSPDTVNTMPEKTLRGDRRPRRDHRRPRSPARTTTPAADASTPSSGRHLLRRRHRRPRARGRRQVRDVLGRAARDRARQLEAGDQGRERGPRASPPRARPPTPIAAHVPTLVADRVASRLFAQDATLWGPAAEAEASKRLALGRACTAPRGRSSARSPRSRAELRGRRLRPRRPVRHGRLLARPRGHLRHRRRRARPCSTPRDPDRSAAAPHRRSTARSSSCRASPAPPSRPTPSAAPSSRPSRDAGIDPTDRIVVVDRPGQPARGAVPRRRVPGRRTPTRRSAAATRRSPPSGSCPAGWPGSTSRPLLDDAEAVADLLAEDDDANPALRLGAAMAGTQPLRDKLVLVDDGTETVGFADWAEQLIAESHRQGRHRHPPGRRDRRPARRTLPPDGTVVRLVSSEADDAPESGSDRTRSSRWRPARRPAAALGGRHGRRRPAARDQPVRPARRRERQGRRPRPARGHGSGDAAGRSPTGRRGPRARRRLARRRERPSPTPCDALLGQLDAEPRLPRRAWPTSTATADADLERRRAGPGEPHRTTGHLRLGPALPALDRAVPQGRAGDRGVPPGHRHAPRRTCRSPAGTSPSASSSPPRRPATPRCWPSTTGRCCGSTSSRTTPGSPRSAPCSARAANEASTCDRGRQPAARPAGTSGCRGSPDRAALVLFGVTGDLSRKKLMPAIYDLANRGLLPPGFALVGFARRDWADQDFAQIVHDAVQGARPHASSARRSGSSWPRASASSRATSTTTTPSSSSPRRSTSSTRRAAPAATTPSTCRSRRGSSAT